MKLTPFIFLFFAFILSGCCSEPKMALPSQDQIAWADSEIGVIIHFEIPTFNPDYKMWQHTLEGASYFNPSDLSTDQWMEVLKQLDVKYAVLVAKHCTGFSLWPTEAHEFSVKNSPWKDGKGDLVREFVTSCNKYGIQPGIYASTFANGYLNIDFNKPRNENGPCTLEEYNKIIVKQLTELWTNYGPLFEVWFDGGVLSKEEGGPDFYDILMKNQPHAIGFQSPDGFPNRIRWVGNEFGFAPDTCWATYSNGNDGYKGNPDAEIWCPGEADFTLRYNETYQGGWFWHEGDDDKIFSVDELMDKYEKSVGRNTNMLLGVVIDNRGRIPDADAQRIKEFGMAIRAKYGSPLQSVSDTEITLDGDKFIDRAIIQEDISFGERILGFRLEGRLDNKWNTLSEGANIGHKRIVKFTSAKYDKLRLVITDKKAKPHIRTFSVFETM